MHSQYKYNISEIYKTTISKNYQKFSDTCGKWVLGELATDKHTII
jgi:hypothetical protein